MSVAGSSFASVNTLPLNRGAEKLPVSAYIAHIAEHEELERSREVWNRLVLAMATPSVFCTWEWVTEWWNCFARGYERLTVVFITNGTELRGIVPLVQHRAYPHRGNWVGERRLSYCGFRDLYGDQVDIICASPDMEPCVETLCRFLCSEYTGWDVWEIPLVRPESGLAICGERLRLVPREGPAVHLQTTSHAPYIDMTKRSFDEHVALLSSHRRYEMRKRKRWMTEKNLQYVAPDPGREGEALEQLFALHAARANQKGMNSTFDRPLVRRFHAAFVMNAAREGWLWLRALKAGSHTIAAYYGFQIGGGMFFFQGGFDPGWEALRPGKALMDEVLREAAAAGCRAFNFLQGDERYKSTWTSDKLALLSGRIYNHTVRGALSEFIAACKQDLKELVRPWKEARVRTIGSDRGVAGHTGNKT